MTVVKVIELIGSSTVNWEDAAKNALAEAAKTVENIKLCPVQCLRKSTTHCLSPC